MPLHNSIVHTIVPLVVGWTLFFFSVTLLPLFFPRSLMHVNIFLIDVTPIVAHPDRTQHPDIESLACIVKETLSQETLSLSLVLRLCRVATLLYDCHREPSSHIRIQWRELFSSFARTHALVARKDAAQASDDSTGPAPVPNTSTRDIAESCLTGFVLADTPLYSPPGADSLFPDILIELITGDVLGQEAKVSVSKGHIDERAPKLRVRPLPLHLVCHRQTIYKS